MTSPLRGQAFCFSGERGREAEHGTRTPAGMFRRRWTPEMTHRHSVFLPAGIPNLATAVDLTIKIKNDYAPKSEYDPQICFWWGKTDDDRVVFRFLHRNVAVLFFAALKKHDIGPAKLVLAGTLGSPA